MSIFFNIIEIFFRGFLIGQPNLFSELWLVNEWDPFLGHLEALGYKLYFLAF